MISSVYKVKVSDRYGQFYNKLCKYLLSQEIVLTNILSMKYQNNALNAPTTPTIRNMTGLTSESVHDLLEASQLPPVFEAMHGDSIFAECST